MFLDNPSHDWSSHDADAFRYLALSWKFQQPKVTEATELERIMRNNPVGMTFGQLREQHFSRRKALREWSNV